MDCNKDEAVRAKELAEKRLAEMDAAGAKRFALKAQKLYPDLDGLSQLLATLDMYISGDKKINGEVDWYGVLGVQPYADDDTIRKQYRKLALILHPDKNKSVGADRAFKIMSEAWNLLSDKDKRISYDKKLNLKGIGTNVLSGNSSASPATANHNDFHSFSKDTISNTSNRHVAPDSKAVPLHSSGKDSFWTTCSSCKMHFQYSRVYVNCNVQCMNCSSYFLAVDIPSPLINLSTKYTPLSDFGQQQKSHRVHNRGQGIFSGLGSSSNISQKGAFPKSGSNIFTSQGAGVNQSASETLRRGIKESHTGIMREESLPMKFHPSQKTSAGLDNSSSGGRKNRPKKRCFNETEMGNHMGMGNEWVSPSSFQKSGFQAGMMNIRGISTSDGMKEPSLLGAMVQRLIRKKLSSSNPASVLDASNKWKAFDEETDKKDESMKPDMLKSMVFADIKSSFQTKKSDAVPDASATKGPEPMTMDVPDPDFHDFDQDRSEKSFGGNQVWAAYDDDDGMPRFYAMIHNVVSVKPFKMRMGWLNSKSNLELAPLNWIGSGFYKTSGDFQIGKYEVNRSLNSFSHKVKWSKGKKGAIQIYPRKGDVWALYRNWSSDWSALTANEVIHKYDMVEVLEDYNEKKGVAVASLAKVPGFKTVFQKNHSPNKNWVIPREELFRLSHQVPSHLLTGQEGENAPKGCLELDPAATPLELLQVLTGAQVKEMEEIKERSREETAEGVNVGQAIVEQEIKETKKPGFLVYARRQRRKLES